MFFCFVTIYNDQISFSKHVLEPFHVSFHPIWVFGGGVPRGLGHNLHMQLSTLYCSKMEISKPVFFDVLTIHNDQISNVQQFLDLFHVFFTRFGCLEGQGDVAQPAHAVFQLRQLKNGNF